MKITSGYENRMENVLDRKLLGDRLNLKYLDRIGPRIPQQIGCRMCWYWVSCVLVLGVGVVCVGTGCRVCWYWVSVSSVLVLGVESGSIGCRVCWYWVSSVVVLGV